MPQMMPINWILLFFFIFSFILFNIINYYIYLPKNKNNSYSMKNFKKNFNWKW